MDLLTKEEIEEFGFKFEPDELKCKMMKIRMHLDCNYYKDGKWTERTTPVITEEWKQRCGEILKLDAERWPYLHRVFVQDVEPMSGEGVTCRWVMIKGHA